MRGMEKTRRKPGLGSWGESRAVSGGTREGTGAFFTRSLPGRRTPGDKRERTGAGRGGKGVPGQRGRTWDGPQRPRLSGKRRVPAGRGQRIYFV